MKITKQLVQKLELFIVVLIIFNSAKISFLSLNIIKLPIFLLILLLYYVKKKPVSFDAKFIIVPVVMLWSVYLAISFNVSYEYLIYFSFIIQLLMIFLLQDIMPKFWSIYSRVVYTLCLISIPFYILQALTLNTLKAFIYAFDPINKILGVDPSKSNILVYTWRKDFGDDFHFRNSGFAHEPGAFSIFILLAIFFSLLENGFRINRRIAVMTLVLFTTLSTQGLLSFGILLLIALLNTRALTNRAKWIFVAAIIPIGILIYSQIDFLDEKIESQVSTQLVDESYKEAYYDRITPGRFGSMILDFNDFEERPFWGYGLNDKTRFYNYNVEQQRTNGLSDFIVKHGIILSLAFFAALYVTNKNRFNLYKTRYHVVGFIFLLMLFFSQPLVFSSIVSFVLLADFSKSKYVTVKYIKKQYKVVI